jgi:hypothetical protein
MADWKDAAHRGLTLLSTDASDASGRTQSLLTHVLDEGNRDDYISKDFFNVQQTAGGLPPDVTMQQFVDAVSGHVRDELTMSNFAADMPDDDFKTAMMTFDDSITRHIRFLNGVVHQIAPGDVHRALWQRILDARGDDHSVYACYRDYLVDA